MFKNYAIAMTMQNTTLKSLESMTRLLLQKKSKLMQVKASTLKEMHWVKRIIVHIDNKADKEKIKMLSIKNLMKALQAKIKNIQNYYFLLVKILKSTSNFFKSKRPYRDK